MYENSFWKSFLLWLKFLQVWCAWLCYIFLAEGFFSTMEKLEMAKRIIWKCEKNAIWYRNAYCQLVILLLSKNQMSKNISHLEMDIFPHFKFFHNRRKCFMLGFADGLIDETCSLQFSFKQNQKIFYADIRCIWNFLFLKNEKIIWVPLYLA